MSTMSDGGSGGTMDFKYVESLHDSWECDGDLGIVGVERTE